MECHVVSREQNSNIMRKRNGSVETSKKYFTSVFLELNLTESNFLSFCIYALIETQGCFLLQEKPISIRGRNNSVTKDSRNTATIISEEMIL